MDLSLFKEEIKGWWPQVPKEKCLDRKKRPLVVSFDLEATGLNPDARIIQLAAYCPKSSDIAETSEQGCPECFNRFVLPEGEVQMEDGAFAKTGMRIGLSENGVRALIDDRTGRVLDTVSEKTALVDLVNWLRERIDKGKKGGGVLLASHGAVLLDVPMVFDAVHRHGLQNKFFSVVVGWCDTLAVFQKESHCHRGHEDPKGQMEDRWFNGGFALDALYTEYVKMLPSENRCLRCGADGGSEGEGGDAHRADADARRLYQLLCSYFEVNEVTLATVPALQPSCFTSHCLKQLTLWRRHWQEEHSSPLWEFIVGSKPRAARAVKKENETEQKTPALEPKPTNGLGVMEQTSAHQVAAKDTSQNISADVFEKTQELAPSKSSVSSIKPPSPQNLNHKGELQGPPHGFSGTHRQQSSGRGNDKMQGNSQKKNQKDGNKPLQSSGPAKPQKGHFIKMKMVIKNILSAGLCLSSLETLWRSGGYDAVVRKINMTKLERESYLSDTWAVSAAEVANHVAIAMRRKRQKRENAKTTNAANLEVASLINELSVSETRQSKQNAAMAGNSAQKSVRNHVFK